MTLLRKLSTFFRPTFLHCPAHLAFLIKSPWTAANLISWPGQVQAEARAWASLSGHQKWPFVRWHFAFFQRQLNSFLFHFFFIFWNPFFLECALSEMDKTHEIFSGN